MTGAGAAGIVEESGGAVGTVLISLAVILLSAKLFGELFERFRQPAVLGELLAGVFLGNLALVGIEAFEHLKHQPVLDVIAEIGIVLLLFEVGLESTVPQMMRVGASALAVAVLGVVAPALLGFGAAWAFYPSESHYLHLFVAAILCATSVGITARVLKDIDRLKTREAQVVLGAAVIDDILGLMLLATVSAIVTAASAGAAVGAGDIAWIAGKAVLFLGAAVVVGLWLSPRLFKAATRLRSRGVLLTFSLCFCFVLAYLSERVGLAPIVGAFTAGLILEEVHFEELASREKRSIHDLLHPLIAVLLPVFFVLMGLKVDLTVFADPSVLLFAGVLTIAAVLGKQACALGVFERGVDRLAVGLGMIPRGEVGLIFAGVGTTLLYMGRPVVGPPVFSAAVIMVMATTLLTPPLLKARFLKLPPPA